jgi:Tfp pilus assembly PilM family ATPase
MRFIQQLKNIIQKPKLVLGITIENYSLKLAAVRHHRNSYRVLDCIELVAEDESSLIRQLQQIVEKNNFSQSFVCLGLDPALTMAKTMELDKTLTDSEIDAVIRERSNSANTANELYIDFEVVGSSKKNMQLNEIRWIAARKIDVDTQCKFLQVAGLSPQVVTVTQLISDILNKTNIHFHKNMPVNHYLANINLGLRSSLWL